MQNPHLHPLSVTHAEAQERLASAQARLEEAQADRAEALADAGSPEQSRAAFAAVCDALPKPGPLALGLLVLSPLHAGGLWLRFRARHVLRLADARHTPSLPHLPRRDRLTSPVAFVGLGFSLGLLGALLAFSWFRDSGLERLWFLNLAEAYPMLDALGLPAVRATSCLGWIFGGACLVSIAGVWAGIFLDSSEETMLGGSACVGISALLMTVFGVTLGGAIAEGGIVPWLFGIPMLAHALAYLRAAFACSTLNRTRLMVEFGEYEADLAKAAEEPSDDETALAEAEAEFAAAEADEQQTREVLDAETARWKCLPRVEQLNEIQLLKDIEETDARIATSQAEADSAQRQADVAERTARRRAEAERQESRFSAQKAADAVRERREAEKAAKQAARPVCRHCGVVEPSMSGNCYRSPTGYHVLLG